jgi:hypothetical protein
MLGRSFMRPSIALALALTTIATPAVAGSSSGGQGGGGPLAGTSSGIGDAVRSGGGGGGGGGGSGNSGPSGGGTTNNDPPRNDCCGDEHGRRRYLYDASGALILAGGVGVATRIREPEPDPKGYHGATINLYVGGHMVKDSDGAVAADLAFVDRRFRVAARAIQYYERLPSNDLLKMTQASLTGGFRIDDMGHTAVFLEGGFVHNKTGGDPEMDTTITGVIGGLHLEHWLNRGTRLVGDAHLMAFPDDIRATSARAGIRFGHFQASMRVLDFNVGPPLWGPELGLAF